MYKRKETEGFNLAFLDIMSCGLGAVILVFMLVKTNVNDKPDGIDSHQELEKLNNDIARLTIIEAQEQQRLENLSGKLDEASKQQSRLKSQLSSLSQDQQQEAQTVQSLQKELEQLKTRIKDIKVDNKADLVETETVNEENYLLGLKVEGQRIAILVDSSASMMHEQLIDIIKTKNGSEREKRTASKWQRTKRIVRWLLARTPANSEVLVIQCDEEAKELGAKKWTKANSNNTVQSILTNLEAVVPNGGTNLQGGLNLLRNYAPSNIYLITDGLPT